MKSEVNFYSRETVDTGLMFHREYIINANNKNVNDLTEYEKSLEFHCDEKPNLIVVDCYLKGESMQFMVIAHIGEGKTYHKTKVLLTKEEYFHLINGLTLENTEY